MYEIDRDIAQGLAHFAYGDQAEWLPDRVLNQGLINPAGPSKYTLTGDGELAVPAVTR